jgi:hypothetical protein
MRVSGVLFIGLLMAAAYGLYLSAKDATTSLDAVAKVAANLREEGVVGSSVDRDQAQRMIAAMNDLLETPETITDHVDDLKVFAETTAAWAQAAPSPSHDLHLAVSLRRAAGELRSYALRSSPVHLMRARRYLDESHGSLAGGTPGAGGPGPGLATGAIRDQLNNLQQSQQEQQQEVDEALKR